MRQKIVKWTALLLAVVMTVQLTAGCSNQANSGTSEDESPVTAESVAFNETGEYTTQLTSSAVDLSDVQKEDVSVTYETLDEDAYQQAVEQAEQDYEQKIEAMVAAVAVTATEVPELEPVWITDYVQEKQVEVLDVQAKKGQLELTFSDPEAAENRTSFYTIHLNGKQYQNADVVAELGVKFKEYALSANIDSVLSNAEETRLTLELNDGAFAETMTQADITLSGSFEQMEIESMSCAGRNLTLQLVGKPEKPEGLTTYVDGVVTVRPQAVVDAGCPLNVYIPIELVGKSFDASTLKMENGTVTAELELVGLAKALEDLGPNDFQFEQDVTVTDVKKAGDTRVSLTMKVNGAADIDAAAAMLNDQTLTIGGEEMTVTAVGAQFYPVFDGIEQDGDDLKITVMAYAENGTFAEDLKAEQVSLAGDFAAGSVQSVDRQSDTTAEIVFTVPAGQQTAETFTLDGTIALHPGAMRTPWGTPSGEDVSYTRNYSQESLGRTGSFGGEGAVEADFGFFTESGARFGGLTSAEFLDINRTFDQFTIEMSFAVEAGEGTEEVMTRYWSRLSEELGNVYQKDMNAISAEGKQLTKLRAIANARSAVIANVASIGMSTVILGVMAYSFCSDLGLYGENKEALEAFRQTEQRTAQLKEAVQSEYHRLSSLKEAALSMTVNNCNVRVSDLEQTMYLCSQYFSNQTVADLGIEMPKEIELDGSTTQFSYDLSVALTDACRHKDAGYENYQEDFALLQEQFAKVCNLLLLEDGADPLTALDQAYANVDNFSTTSYLEKRAYRVHLSTVLDKAMDLIRWYKLASYKFELDDDGKLVVATNEDGFDFYPVNQSTIDTTLDDLGQEALLRLATEAEPIDMYGQLASAEKDLEIDNETLLKNSAEYQKYYDVFKYNQYNQIPGMAEKMAMSALMQNNPEVLNQNFHYNVVQKDLSGFSNEVFAQQEACFEIENMQASEKYTSNVTASYTDADSHWGTRTYHPLEAYVQDPGSEARHSVQAAKPYCYSLHTTVSLVDNCYTNDDVFRAYTNFTALEVAEFFNRLEDSGRTLLEELENAGIPISEEYANASEKRGTDGDSVDSNNLYGIALNHTTAKKYDAAKVKNSWNTYADLYYWDAKSQKDKLEKVFVWRGLSNEAQNKVAVLIP